MNISKSSAPYVVAPLIFVMHLLNGAQVLNNTCFAGATMTVISLLTKM